MHKLQGPEPRQEGSHLRKELLAAGQLSEPNLTSGKGRKAKRAAGPHLHLLPPHSWAALASGLFCPVPRNRACDMEFPVP